MRGLSADRLQRDATWRKSLEVRHRLVGYLRFFSHLSATQSAILSRQERNLNSRWSPRSPISGFAQEGAQNSLRFLKV